MLGDVVVSVERMPVGEVHLCLGTLIPGPGLAGVLVPPTQPPPLLSPGDGDQGGDQGGEEVTHRGGQGEGVTVVIHQGSVLLLRVDLSQVA